MNKEEMEAFIKDFIDMGVYDIEVDIEPKEIIKEEEALYFELVEQTKELPDSEIFDIVKCFFEELRGVENAK